MKTLLQTFLLLVVILFSFNGCGSNGAKREMMVKDCLAKDEFMKDSIAKVEAAAAAAAASRNVSADEKPLLANSLSSNTKAPKDRSFIKTASIKFRVRNVAVATEKIEDITSGYGGYVKSSNLANRTENYSREIVRNDSVLISQQIVVENQMVLRVPNEKLDSFLRSMNPLIDFLDYRNYNMDDVTLRFIRNNKDVTRLKRYNQRQTAHIDYKDSKLKETAAAEENLLEKQQQSDNLQVNNMELSDEVNYCTLSLTIYQKPIIVREVLENFNEYGHAYKPSLGSRIGNGLVNGWDVLEEIIVFVFTIWPIILLILIVGYLVRVNLKAKSKSSSK